MPHSTFVFFFFSSEHNQWEKKTNFELSARVPLIIRVPWKSSAVGQKTDALVELVDLYPTIASLAGLPPPGGLENQGTNLAPLFDSPSAGASFKSVAFTQYPVCSPPQRVREFPAG